ncbi:MAG: Cyclase/dehydrase [Thermoleophilia bacterium]|jgi:uncharacterized membrane protein|nr:Cyclase/dehydrase [Thermoleophilia bacterium]
MPTRRGSIIVATDAMTAWRVCADLRRFPDFIAGITAFEELANGTHRWRGRAFGIDRTWTSTWVARDEPTLVAWRTDDPMVPDGHVTVHPLAPHRCRVTIEMHYEPRSLADHLLVNPVATRVRLWWDLRSFRRHAEQVAQKVGTGGIDDRMAEGASSALSSALSARSSDGREVGSSWHSRQRGS